MMHNLFARTWRRWIQRLYPATQRRSRRGGPRLQLERLEDRTVPATITLASVNFYATALTQFSGTVATFTDTDPTAVAGNFTATINWGDTHVSPADGNAVTIVADAQVSGQFDLQGKHTYAARGSFSVQVTVADNQGNTATAAAYFSQANLVTDNQANLMADGFTAAAHTDPSLLNPWGIAFAPSGPFWVANNNSGTSTLYDGTGTPQAGAITIAGSTNPGAISPGPATGTVYNATSDFTVSGPGTAAQFIFATEDGTIAAWYAGSTAPVKVDNADFNAGPVYKGLAIGNNGSGNFLYATNFRAGTIDVFDKNFQKVTLGAGGFGTFTDPDPNHDLTGFAPFGIQNIAGKLYVTYAMQNAAKHDDVGGAGNGFVDVFDLSGNFIKRLASHGTLDSPWGLALAPSTFGAFANDLLVGNFKGGQISAFDPSTGAFKGQLNAANGQPITILGLWGLTFGNNGGAGSANTLFFAAGINSEAHGLFGSFTLIPANGGTATVLPPGFVYGNGVMQIFGTNFTYSQATTAIPFGTHTTYTFAMDGNTVSFPDTLLVSVDVRGQGTNATATLITNDTYIGIDGQQQETAEAVYLVGGNSGGGAQLYRSGYYGLPFFDFMNLSSFPTIYAYAGHADIGQLGATEGMQNIFVTAGSYSYMTNASQFHLISGAATVYGYASPDGNSSVGGNDQAWHYDTAALDAFVSSGHAFSYMSGTDAGQPFFNEAVGFDVNYGIATHGMSIAYLIDSPGNDVFAGYAPYSYMSGSDNSGNLFNVAEGFALVYGQSFVGGTDFAYNFDPAHNVLNSRWVRLT